MFHTDIVTMVQTALVQGKIRPDQKKWAMDFAAKDPRAFEVFVNKAHTVTLPPSQVKNQTNEINEMQREINKQCGVDDETYRKFGPDQKPAEVAHGAGGTEKTIDETQRLINALFGIGDETAQIDSEDDEEPIDETQRLINRLMGVNDETWRKFRPKGTPTK